MIELYTAATPNGRKVSIALEEMELSYTVHVLDLAGNDQKQPDFLTISPNGRIPAIVDHDQQDFAVFESGAILVYLAEKTGRFLPQEIKARSRVMQWLMFQMGGLGPMQGQAHVFYWYAPEKIDYAIQRYQRETRRLYTVLDDQFAKNEYLAGDYSIADMAAWPWVVRHDWAGVPIDDLRHLRRWLEVVGTRPGVQRGKDVPPVHATAAEVIREGSNILV